MILEEGAQPAQHRAAAARPAEAAAAGL